MPRYSRLSRLQSQRDFDHVFANPFKVTHKGWLALYRPNQGSQARLGIVISKIHVKRAVDRNLLRRLIRESFRPTQEALKGLDIIVLMRSKWCLLKKKPDKKVWRDEVDKLWQLLINSLPQR